MISVLSSNNMYDHMCVVICFINYFVKCILFVYILLSNLSNFIDVEIELTSNFNAVIMLLCKNLPIVTSMNCVSDSESDRF